MLNLKSVLHTAIPAVNPLDVQRLWTLQSQYAKDSGVAFTTEAILQVCASQAADPVAVWARTTLINILLEAGHLESWRENGGLNNTVFETLAVFPLPAGLQQFDPSEFLNMMSRE
ncbi:MAG TPA: hypothetical protein VK638_48945 [Edaphobacter sp.]|nr:hypothetical protein [Edaphobacter sp.]